MVRFASEAGHARIFSMEKERPSTDFLALSCNWLLSTDSCVTLQSLPAWLVSVPTVVLSASGCLRTFGSRSLLSFPTNDKERKGKFHDQHILKVFKGGRLQNRSYQ